MKRLARLATPVLLLLVLIEGGGNLLATYLYVNASRAAQQRAGQVVEHKLCETFGRLAALKPPPGDPADNPSRAYLQGEHAVLEQVSPDIDCPGSRS